MTELENYTLLIIYAEVFMIACATAYGLYRYNGLKMNAGFEAETFRTSKSPIWMDFLSVSVERLIHVFTDWILYISLFSIILKTLLVMGVVLYDTHSFSTLLTSYKEIFPLFYLSFITAVFSISFLLKKRAHLWFLIGLNFFLSLVHLADLWYYRIYADFLTVHLALHTLNWKTITENILPAITAGDFVYVLDAVVLIVLAILNKNLYKNMTANIPAFILLFSLSIGFISSVNTDAREKNLKLFHRNWAPNETIVNLSPVGYHNFDIYNYWNECRTIKLGKDRKQAITDWFVQKKEDLPDNHYKAIFKGKNLIIIQVESLENFVINQKINGKEITPTLNSLLKNSLYFSNYRDQTKYGNSSDGDLLLNNSIYPLANAETSMHFPYTTYNSLPKLLRKAGYSTLAVKADKPSGWNWVQSLTSMGYQKCLDIASFQVDETIGLGLSDGSFFRQMEPIIQKQTQPFFTYLVTLSGHGPFALPYHLRELDLTDDLGRSAMGGYLECVHYTDKHIGIFMSKLEEAGVLENAVVVITGDHCGVHKYDYGDRIPKEQQEIWWEGNDKQLPLIIYNKEFVGEEIKVNGGQVDALPTLAYLMGLDNQELAATALGRNLLNTRKDFAVLSDGGLVGFFADEGEKKQALDGLNIADDIIRSNYFRKDD